ncbi:MAG: phosphoenolpyruvate carboxykinase domain-containing protein, partial [Monoglobus pectinilyticus]
FRKDDEGNFMWPGFGDNMRVLLWILDRVSGKADAHDSAIGLLPTASDIDTTGLGISAEELDALLSVDKEVWKEDVENIKEYFAQFGDRLPADIKKQLEILDKNLND